MQETEATISTSFGRSNKLLVAESRNCSMFSLIALSFSIYKSLEGTYASG